MLLCPISCLFSFSFPLLLETTSNENPKKVKKKEPSLEVIVNLVLVRYISIILVTLAIDKAKQEKGNPYE